METELPVASFAEALGSSDPTPGGGAASAVAAALAAALAEMVARISRARADGETQRTLHQAVDQAGTLRRELVALIDEDARAYAHVDAALRLPRATDAEREARREQLQAALRAAMRPPSRIMELAAHVLPLAELVAIQGRPALASDAACAALLAEAAVRCAGLNVLANADLLSAHDVADAARHDVVEHEKAAETGRARVLAVIEQRRTTARASASASLPSSANDAAG